MFRIHFWLFWAFVAAHSLSLAAASRGYSLVARRGFLTAVASLCFCARALGCAGFSRCGSQTLGRRLSSCRAQAQLLCSNPGQGVEPMSSALAGRFFTTEPSTRKEAAEYLLLSPVIMLEEACIERNQVPHLRSRGPAELPAHGQLTGE